MVERQNSLILPSIIISVGLVAGAFIFSSTQKQLRLFDRVVTVKGLVERDVMADVASWSLNISATNDDLAAAQAQIEKTISTIRSFLIQKGFKEEEIDVPSIIVTDRLASEYGEQKAGQMRYIVRSSVNLRSNNIELVQKVSRMTSELVKAGITLAAGNCPGPSFMFTRLNELKPEMLVEATQNARKAGNQFASDSGSTLGKIKRASQGVFSISERDKVSVDGGDGQTEYSNCNSSPNKRVRVVTTIDYYLE